MGIILRTATSMSGSSDNLRVGLGDPLRASVDTNPHAASDVRARRTDTSISFTGVRVERGHVTVLDVDQLDVDAGYTALVGPNGSGKSTMLHVIAGLLRPTAGAVTVGSGGSRSRNVSYVLQSQHASEQLLVTAREVVQLARRGRRFGRASRADRQMVDETLERLGVADLANRHLADMSGGQRQRVFIAQGLAQEADILLLDEPVAGLDLASEQTIRSAIDEECASGRTVVVATHDLDEASRADRVVMLNGTVVAAGSPAEVLQPEFLRQAYRGRVLELGDGSIAVDDDHHH
ncbi:MAG: ABC-type Mn2+/Zn2+ transport system ATPase subunit [Candidatus Aldehydirespiratoraceae bacterium]|jgi:ABC-type Mn2+/Zn2+ transport system ATPase subunit